MLKKTKRPVPEDVDCRYCVRYNQGKSCELLDCNILSELIESGNIGYEDLIENAFYYHPELTRRLQYLIKTFPGTMWADDLHERRFCYSTGNPFRRTLPVKRQSKRRLAKTITDGV